MGVVLGFLVGWAVGSKAGPKGFEEVLSAARTVKESEEFAALVDITRTHLAAALREMGSMVSGAKDGDDEDEDLVFAVRRLVARGVQ